MGTFEKKEFAANSGEMKIHSELGIRCDNLGYHLILSIPQAVFGKLGDRDAIRRGLHPQIFDGSLSLSEDDVDEWHIVKFPTNTPQEKIQQLVDEIEDIYDKSLQLDK